MALSVIVGIPTAVDAPDGEPPPSEVGEWSAVIPFPTIPIHTHLLPTGEVLFWDRHDFPTGDGQPRLWSPQTGLFRMAAEPPMKHDLFCSGHSLLADGRLFVAGGHISDGHGQPYAAIYDPFEDFWTAVPEMNAGRWYPSAATLADSTVVVLAGDDENGADNRLPQIFRPASGDWRELATAELTLPYYPFLFQAPDGAAFVAGPAAQARRLDLAGSGSWSFVDSGVNGFRGYGSAAA